MEGIPSRSGILMVVCILYSSASAEERKYFIGAVDVEWNYIPSGRNMITNEAFSVDSFEADFVITGPNRIGPVYRKSLYRRFTDSTFTNQMPHPEHLGILGPVITAEVGDTIVVHFKNMATYAATMHPHGVLYKKDSEGAIYEDGTSGADKADDRVKPGDSHIYTWLAKERAGPTKDEDGCAHWLYHSHIETSFGTNAGLLGPMLICRKGFLREDGTRRDVDKVFYLMITVIDENSSYYIDYNVQTYAGTPNDIDLEDEGFVESNKMRSINGYMFGNLPGLDMCQNDRIEWNIFSTGTEVDVHSITYFGNALNFRGHIEKTISITPAVSLNAIMNARNSGTWLLTSDVTTHIRGGMQALYNVELCGWTPSEPEVSGTVREYYIAAVEKHWNYAPTGMNGPHNLTNDSRPESVYFSKTGNRIGGIYRKALYREYTNSSFVTEKVRTTEEGHLGFLGPVIKGEVGDQIVVTFRNMATRNYSIHAEGVHYDKSNEGAYYNDGMTDHSDDSVAPGEEYIYHWTIPDYLSPTELDEECITWTYRSMVDQIRDVYSGLIGFILVCKSGTLNEDGKQTDIDDEFALLYTNTDENWSHYLDENIQQFCNNPGSVDKEDGDFMESNIMRGINGYMYFNLPGLRACVGDLVSWHVASYGKETDMHIAIFQQQLLVSDGNRRDGIALYPGTSHSFRVRETFPGTWTIVCYVTTHFEGGTRANIFIDESCGSYNPEPVFVRNVYYFAAIDIQWEYVPVRYDPVRSQSLDNPDSPGNIFVRNGSHSIGSKYKKAVFRQYTDDTFTQKSPREKSWGILGNPIYAEVGEAFDVVFKNLASRPFGFYIHGARWTNFNSLHIQNGIPPSETFRYNFLVPEDGGPTDTEANCSPFLYSSPVSHLRDAPTGVVGPFVVCKKGVLLDGKRTDGVDVELFLYFTVFDENKSWYLDDNIQSYAGKPDEVDKSDPDFEESNLMHSINGFLFHNLKYLDMTVGETTEWYLLALGDEVDLHTVHFHGQTVVYRTEGTVVADVYELAPGITAAVRMIPDNPGEWLLHCHVNDHILGGMETSYRVLPRVTAEPTTEDDDDDDTGIMSKPQILITLLIPIVAGLLILL